MKPAHGIGLPYPFMAYVLIRPRTRCWHWTGDRTGLRYGRIRLGTPRGKNTLAHRYSYARAYGEIPAGTQVLHSCDNPACVNPEHLRLGSQSENIAESWAKGRQPGRWGKRRATP